MNGSDKVDLYVNAMVREVLTDAEGKATGVSYVNKKDRQEYQVRARSVVLAASACSTARILLNSKSEQHPNGLGNSSDVVGRYVHDSTGASRAAIQPELLDRKRYNEDGVGGMHVYTPWWLNEDRKRNFSRGYHIEVWGGMGMPSYGTGFNLQGLNEVPNLNANVSSYGTSFKNDVRRFYGAMVGMSGRGESVPQRDNYCEIDPNVVDQWGIPVLRFNYNWSDQEINQAKHMQDTFEEIINAMGAIPLGEKPGKDSNYGLAAPGRIIHEVGTTRMGTNPKASATNVHQQLHDVNNVYIMDAGPFVSQADKIPTWTIMALAWRASEHLIGELTKKNI